MPLSESSLKLREIIEHAIDDQMITKNEMDKIINIATEDGHIDAHEQSLLNQLQDMIESKMVKIVP